MRLTTMEVTDFGPYRGTQQFVFAEQPGVELIWGENGRGKTNFLNALRWALFGVVLGRTSSRIDPATVGNRDDGATATALPFKVTLNFGHDGHTYKLTRAYREGPQGGEASFRTTVSLVKDGDVLGPEERERALATLLPEQIARFFLFDAELLQEYEQLLVSGSDVGDKLKASIERILGVPVLTHARDDVATLLATARKAQAKAAQQDRETRELGNELQLVSDQVEQQRVNVVELGEQVEQLQNDLNERERDLNNNTRFRSLVTSRDEKQREVKRREERARERREEFDAAAGDTWRAVLAPVVTAELAAIETRTDAVSAQLADALAARQRATAVSTGVCPTCNQPVGGEAARVLQGHTPREDIDALQSELSRLRARRDALRRMRVDTDRLIRAEAEDSQARVDLSDAKGELSDLEAQLADAPKGTEETITTLIAQHSDTTVSLRNTRDRLKDSRAELVRKEQAVVSISETLRKRGARGAGEHDRTVSVLSELHSLLTTAVNEFRDRLRDRIEEQASEVFRVLSAETDYQRLRINDNYGLTILHGDGSEVINRSSGYEHVVALSLIAALQRCSPMSGPIITDSPFGRLDKTHKEHILQALPQITDQVLLLVHDEELNRPAALNKLATELVGEHHLRRVTSRHTQIENGPHP